MPRIVVTASIVCLAVACKNEERLDPSLETLGRASGPVAPAAPQAAPEERPPVHDDPGMPAGAPQGAEAPKLIQGEVLETIDVTRYTYIHLKGEAGELLWAAVPKTALEVGEPVEIVQSLVMENFESKTLNRTFPFIVFGVVHDKTDAPAAPAN
jgi:hypothetical protein